MSNVLSIKDLTVSYETMEGAVYAIDEVNFSLDQGQSVGIVGESGSGKTTLGMAIGRLLPSNGKLRSGEIFLNGIGLFNCEDKMVRSLRKKNMGFIFQNPMTSLNPTMRVRDQLKLAMDRKNWKADAQNLLKQVGLPYVDQVENSFPHQLSGGMAQRVAIAMAISRQPKILIADEPTSSLDTTVRDQILKLLISLQSSAGLSLVILSHDLRLVSKHCDIVAVMYGGRLVEQGPSKSVFKHPRHPYTKALIESAPGLEVPDEMIPSIPGVPPILFETVRGCSYMDRCNWAVSKCRDERPAARQIDEQNVICHRAEQI